MRRFALLIAGLALLAGIAATVSGSATQAKPHWVITDLGTLGGRESEARDINERGQIVGRSDTKFHNGLGEAIHHAVLWQNGEIIDLASSLPPHVDSLARAINDRGDVVVDTDGDFLWRNGKLTRLGLSLSGVSNDPLNERGQVIGITRKQGLDYAAVWDRGRITVLGSLAHSCRTDYGQSDPVAINERGQIIGMSATDVRDRDGNCVEHAFLWQSGKMRDLGVLPEELHDTVYPPSSKAWDINDKGEIVGLSQTRRKNTENPWPLSGDHAVLWQKGRIIDLGSLVPNRYDLRLDSWALAINERGAVVGYSDTGNSSSGHASLWRGGKVIDLLPRGKYGSQADAISEGGRVLGFGRTVFVWQNGKATYLGRLVPGTGETHARDLNNENQVVGSSAAESRKNAHCTDPDGQRYACRHAVLWTLKRG